jgi:hypothetical protein
MSRSAPSTTGDAVLPGRLAELLADHGHGALTEALDLVVAELGLRSAVLRDADPDSQPAPGAPVGRLRAVAGEAVHAVPTMRVVPSSHATTSTVELPVRAGGREVGVLTVVGARPSQLPVLRAVAAVLGLALGRTPRVAPGEVAADLVAAADAEADAAADLLHDGPVQALVVAHYAAEAATRGGDPRAAREAVQSALVELRRSLWHLRPRGPGEGGLPAALGLLSARLEEAGRPPLGFVLDELVAVALPSAVSSTAYRLVQAVALPEGADPVRVALRREGSTVVLDVEGGAPLHDHERWANRARALGGSLTSSEARTRLAVPLTTPRTKATS